MVKNEIPVIDLDNPDKDALAYALREYGSFEIKGSVVEALKPYAQEALNTTKQVYNLDKEVLNKVAISNREFQGFQNVKKETKNNPKEGRGARRYQKAYHFNPNHPRVPLRIPEGINPEAFHDYLRGTTVLYTLYTQMAEFFIDSDRRTDFSDAKHSVLTTRLYSPVKNKTTDENIPQTEEQRIEATGIPAHSDYGTLTLVFSNKPGLEVYKDGEWVSAPNEPAPRFFVNVGDWCRFQMNHPEFKVGIHRVPAVKEPRHSLALFVNEADEKIIQFPNGRIGRFIDYLKSNKAPFINGEGKYEPRDNPTPIEAPKNIPALYVVESGASKPEWMLVRGNGQALSTTSPKGFSYAYTSLDERKNTRLTLTEEDELRTYEVNLKYANDIYVVDEAAAMGIERGEASRTAISNTMVPLKDYDGSFKKPTYLISRPLEKNEARDITHEKFISSIAAQTFEK
jgi:isopenicillin N synthase-like dioxygenase